MKTVLTNKNISIRTRRRALECYIEPILLYGCEAWTLSKQTQKKLEATEMWFLRRMLRISWTAKKTNDTVLEEAHTTRLLISKIRKRQATFFGHVMRREKLENLVTTGMLEGKRSRGKQREKLIEGLTDWLKAGKSLEAIEATKDRKKWRTMIANAAFPDSSLSEIPTANDQQTPKTPRKSTKHRPRSTEARLGRSLKSVSSRTPSSATLSVALAKQSSVSTMGQVPKLSRPSRPKSEIRRTADIQAAGSSVDLVKDERKEFTFLKGQV
ncbi:endonuclease-reverse transcriptase [Plakobranchus ocellatus]|uniref:Endonuclease-reverse transcriptase n=1 Tax=Plakobranchus ocellatus TaxID=259542 RepID=A0AAV3ZVU2_9GAST|nr:endonuclease-reverse transcriptase [Plakobranchus ocellatus]